MAELPKIVSQRLHAAGGVRVHPDPDLITAFVEKSLGNRERVQVLEHLSRCAGCREIVSLVAVQPDIAGAVSVVPGNAGWLSWPVLRWGAAVACVIVVGAAVTLRHKQGAPQIAPMLSEGKPTVGAQIQALDSAFVKKAASPPLSDRGAKTGVVAKQAEQPAQAGPNRQAAQMALAAGASAPAAPSGNYAAAAPGPVEMADARTVSPMAEMVPGRAKAAFAEQQDAHAEKAFSGVLAKKRSMAVAPEAASVAGDASLPASLSPRWTLSSDGTLQRSLDSGGTWRTIPVSSKTIFRALAANGLDIWVGGSDGALFHSSDAGQHWTQVRPVANGEALVDDIIGVEFTDLLHGKVTTSGAETWTTADAGQTWQRQ
jgi:hypothetical protein